MKKILDYIVSLWNFFQQEKLTEDDVLSCVPTTWICIIHGQDSLRKRLEIHYALEDGELSDAEVLIKLKGLEAKGLIELEMRQRQNPIDKKPYFHQQCRKARTIQPNLPERSEAAPELATA
ncbi:hypothetical protein K2P47_01595 [Patescibacteria group bacterium]|nr:hypothetical protein [Patescibacteria group bacterium]